MFLKLPLNENDNNFDGKWNDINYKRTFIKLHDAGQKNSFSLLMRFLFLVMDVVCLIILNFIIKI